MRDKLRALETGVSKKDKDEAIEAEDTGGGVEAPAAKSEAPNMARRQILAALGVGLLAGAGGGFAAGNAYGKRGARGRRKPKPPPKSAYVEIQPWNPSRGPDPARVTMVIFTDFQCPFCGRVLESFNELMKTYPEDMRMVLKHRPLEFHKKAKPAAVAMLAADKQGKGWEMHDLMFANRKQLDRSHLVGYATKLGLDVAAFEAAMDDATLAEQVDKDSKYGLDLGATGTPTAFINGRGIRGAKPYGNFDEIVKEEIAEAKKLEAAGTPLAEIYKARCEANKKAFKAPAS
jgi:protein-disulfide isomerase